MLPGAPALHLAVRQGSWLHPQIRATVLYEVNEVLRARAPLPVLLDPETEGERSLLRLQQVRGQVPPPQYIAQYVHR